MKSINKSKNDKEIINQDGKTYKGLFDLRLVRKSNVKVSQVAVLLRRPK